MRFGWVVELSMWTESPIRVASLDRVRSIDRMRAAVQRHRAETPYGGWAAAECGMKEEPERACLKVTYGKARDNSCGREGPS